MLYSVALTGLQCIVDLYSTDNYQVSTPLKSEWIDPDYVDIFKIFTVTVINVIKCSLIVSIAVDGWMPGRPHNCCTY